MIYHCRKEERAGWHGESRVVEGRNREFRDHVSEDVSWVGVKAGYLLQLMQLISHLFSFIPLHRLCFSLPACAVLSVWTSHKKISFKVSPWKGIRVSQEEGNSEGNKKSWAHTERCSPFKESQVPEASHPNGIRSNHTSQPNVRHLRSPSKHSSQCIQVWLEVKRTVNFLFLIPGRINFL